MFYHTNTGDPAAVAIDFAGGWANWDAYRTARVNERFKLKLQPQQCSRQYFEQQLPWLAPAYQEFSLALHTDPRMVRELQPMHGAVSAGMRLKDHVIPYTLSSRSDEAVSLMHDWFRHVELLNPIFHVGIFGTNRRDNGDYASKADFVSQHDEIVAVVDNENKKVEPFSRSEVANRVSLYVLDPSRSQRHLQGVTYLPGWFSYGGMSAADRILRAVAAAEHVVPVERSRKLEKMLVS